MIKFHLIPSFNRSALDFYSTILQAVIKREHSPPYKNKTKQNKPKKPHCFYWYLQVILCVNMTIQIKHPDFYEWGSKRPQRPTKAQKPIPQII